MAKTDKEWTDRKKWIMGIVAAVVVAAAGALLFDPVGTFISKKLEQSEPTTVRITASIRTYDIVSDQIGSPQIVELPPASLDTIEEVVREELWPQMRAVIVPGGQAKNLTVNLRISDAGLYADQPFDAFFEWRYLTPAQVLSPQRKLREGRPVDLTEAFRLTENPSGESENELRIQLEHPSGKYRRAYITVLRANGFVFKSTSTESVNLELKPVDKRTRLLMGETEVKGMPSPLADSVLVRFRNTLHQTAQESHDVELVGFTFQELREKREELKKTLEMSPGKVDVLEDLAVDFIVDTTLLFE